MLYKQVSVTFKSNELARDVLIKRENLLVFNITYILVEELTKSFISSFQVQV